MQQLQQFDDTELVGGSGGGGGYPINNQYFEIKPDIVDYSVPNIGVVNLSPTALNLAENPIPVASPIYNNNMLIANPEPAIAANGGVVPADLLNIMNQDGSVQLGVEAMITNTTVIPPKKFKKWYWLLIVIVIGGIIYFTTNKKR
jgi:hypothetical protein